MQLLTNLKNKLLRRSRRKRASATKPKSPVAKSAKPNLMNRFGSGKLLYLLGGLTAVLVVYSIVIPFAQLLFINTSQHSSTANLPKPTWVKEGRFTLMLVGLDKYGEYSFVDNLTLLIYDPGQGTFGFFVVNPDIEHYSSTISANVTIRTVFNMYEAKGQELPVLREVVEKLAAVKINRYIVIDQESFTKVAADMPAVGVELSYDLQDSEIIEEFGVWWRAGEGKVKPSELAYYLAADFRGSQAQMQRQLMVLTELSKSSFGYKSIIKIPKFSKTFIQTANTDMSKRELGWLAYRLSRVQDNKIKTAFTREASLFYKESGSIYPRYSVDQRGFDSDISSVMINPLLAREQARIEIFNASGTSGLARVKERALTNIGARVIQVGNNPEDFERTTIYVEDRSKYKLTLKEIENLFGGRVEYAKTEYKYRSVGDIIIVIGKDE